MMENKRLTNEKIIEVREKIKPFQTYYISVDKEDNVLKLFSKDNVITKTIINVVETTGFEFNGVTSVSGEMKVMFTYEGEK